MVALEKSAIVVALEAANGNLIDAARTLGVSWRTLYRRVDEFGLRTKLEQIRKKAPRVCPTCRRPY